MSSRSASIGSLESSRTDNLSQLSLNSHGSAEEPLISGLHHVNLLVPPQTLCYALEFYGGILGLRSAPVPASSKAFLAWFDIDESGQQIHVSSQYGLSESQLKAQAESPRHPCFKISSQQKLDILQRRILDFHEKGGEGAPIYCDKMKEKTDMQTAPGGFPNRFFARDYAGNRLEFSL